MTPDDWGVAAKGEGWRSEAPADAFRNDSRVTPSPSVLALLITAPLRGAPGPVWLEQTDDRDTQRRRTRITG